MGLRGVEDGEVLIDVGNWKPPLLLIEVSIGVNGLLSVEVEVDARAGVSHDVSKIRLKSVLQESMSAGMGDWKENKKKA